MLQEAIVALFFLGALLYLGRIMYRQFQAKSACTTGCGKCNAVDFSKIETDLKAKGL